MSLIEEYRNTRHEYEAATTSFRKLIEGILSDRKDEIHHIEDRCKDVEKLEEKIERKEFKYENLDNVSDLCGVRVITYYQDSARAIAEILKAELELIEVVDHSSHDDEPGQFGYESIHLVLTLDWMRRQQPENRPCGDKRVEVQIRTVCQHAWAAISHKLTYKTGNRAPAVERQLNRLSALLEIADDQFIKIRDSVNKAREDYDAEFQSGNFAQELNWDSLIMFLENHFDLPRFYDVVESLGMPLVSRDNDGGENADFAPILLELLGWMGISSIDALRTAVNAVFQQGSNLGEWLEQIGAELIDRYPMYKVCTLQVLLILIVANSPQITDLDAIGAFIGPRDIVSSRIQEYWDSHSAQSEDL